MEYFIGIYIFFHFLCSYRLSDYISYELFSGIFDFPLKMEMIFNGKDRKIRQLQKIEITLGVFCGIM